MRRFCGLLVVVGIAGCGTAGPSAAMYGHADATAILPDDQAVPSAIEIERYDNAMASAENELGLVSTGEYRAVETETRVETQATGASEAPPPVAPSPVVSSMPEPATSDERLEQDEASRGSGDSDRRREVVDQQCSRPRRLVALVCELAVRMCTISSAHPSETALSQRCERGRARCDAAQAYRRNNGCS